MITPLRNPTTRDERRYDLAHARTRGIIERTYGMIKRRFLTMQDPLRARLRNVFAIIIATAVLHNKALNRADGVPDGAELRDDDTDEDEETEDEDAPDGIEIRRRIISNMT